MINKIISGGQTGADKGALIAALECGIPTGGMAPKGFKTEIGTDLTLLTKYKLIESDSSDYTVRTLKNVKTSDCTIIFCDKYSKGSVLTEKLCVENNKPFLKINTLNYSIEDLNSIKLFIKKLFDEKNRKIFLNIAGNRESKSPGIEKRTITIITTILLED